jgi:hypothetical protein
MWSLEKVSLIQTFVPHFEPADGSGQQQQRQKRGTVDAGRNRDGACFTVRSSSI